MAVEELSYRDYWNIFKRRWWIATACAVAGAAAGVGVARWQAPKPIYASTAVVSYQAERGFAVAGTPIEIAGPTNVASQILFIRSPIVLGAAAKRLRLIPEDTARDAYAPLQPVLSKLASQFIVFTDPGGRSGVLQIRAWDEDRERAAEIANAVMDAYRDENRFLMAKNIVLRREFLQNQIGDNEKALNEAQLDYELFRREHPEAAIEPGLQGSISSIARAEATMQALAEKVRETRRQISLVQDGRAPSDIGLQLIVGATATARLQQLSRHYTELTIKKANLLTELTEAHPAVVHKEQQLANARDDLEAELQLILDAFEKQQEEEQEKVEELREREKTLPQEAMQLAQLSRRVKVFENIQIRLRQQLEDALLKEAGVTGQVVMVSAATPSAVPVNPPAYARFGGLGLATGFVLGFLVAVLVETSRFSLRTLRRMEESLDVTVLGINPRVTADMLQAWTPGARRPRRGSPEWTRSMALATLLAPRSAVGESFRTLRANVQTRIQSGEKVFTITASSRGAGATMTAINLALSCAHSGQRALLIEADFREPTISTVLGLQREPGLSDVVLQSSTLTAATRAVADFVTFGLSLDEVLLGPGMDQFHVMPCGRTTEHAAELFGSDSFAAALMEMRNRYDVVVFDSPPLNTGADALVLGRRSGIIVVHDPRRSDEAALEATLAQLRKAECTIVGLFVNGMELEAVAVETETAEPARAAL